MVQELQPRVIRRWGFSCSCLFKHRLAWLKHKSALERPFSAHVCRSSVSYFIYIYSNLADNLRSAQSLLVHFIKMQFGKAHPHHGIHTSVAVYSCIYSILLYIWFSLNTFIVRMHSMCKKRSRWDSHRRNNRWIYLAFTSSLCSLQSSITLTCWILPYSQPSPGSHTPRLDLTPKLRPSRTKTQWNTEGSRSRAKCLLSRTHSSCHHPSPGCVLESVYFSMSTQTLLISHSSPPKTYRKEKSRTKQEGT